MSASIGSKEPKDPAGAAVRAAALGSSLGASLIYALFVVPHRPGLPLYVAFLSLFHLLEYWTTARFNERNVNNKSFLLSSNGLAYWAAQLLGAVEYLLRLHFFPRWPRTPSLYYTCFITGLVLVVGGQTIRSAAMIRAAQSFSHALAYAKKDEHVLVTSGIYQYFRHPSYFGFFWFGIGTQVMLLNPLSTAIFAMVLWKFFKERIR